MRRRAAFGAFCLAYARGIHYFARVHVLDRQTEKEKLYRETRLPILILFVCHIAVSLLYPLRRSQWRVAERFGFEVRHLRQDRIDFELF